MSSAALKKKVRMRKLFLIIFVLLCGCVHTQNRFLYSNENGHEVYQTDCSWTDFGDCLIEANRMCPAGYDIVMSSETPTGNFANFDTKGRENSFGDFSSYNSSTSGTSWNTYKRYLIYACKAVKLQYLNKND